MQRFEEAQRAKEEVRRRQAEAAQAQAQEAEAEAEAERLRRAGKLQEAAAAGMMAKHWKSKAAQVNALATCPLAGLNQYTYTHTAKW